MDGDHLNSKANQGGGHHKKKKKNYNNNNNIIINKYKNKYKNEYKKYNYTTTTIKYTVLSQTNKQTESRIKLPKLSDKICELSVPN